MTNPYRPELPPKVRDRISRGRTEFLRTVTGDKYKRGVPDFEIKFQHEENSCDGAFDVFSYRAMTQLPPTWGALTRNGIEIDFHERRISVPHCYYSKSGCLPEEVDLPLIVNFVAASIFGALFMAVSYCLWSGTPMTTPFY